ncbi:hypothetical protein OZZ16_14215, partial [[Ruminococcus] gnavus]
IDSFENKNTEVKFPKVGYKFQNCEVQTPIREVYKIKPYSYEEEIRALFLDFSGGRTWKKCEH